MYTVHNPRNRFPMCFIRFINGNDSIYWRPWHKRLDIYNIYIYITFLRLPSTSDLPNLASLIISSRKTWIPYLILLSDLYSKGRQLSPLEGSCFQHLYIALRGRVPRCRRVFGWRLSSMSGVASHRASHGPLCGMSQRPGWSTLGLNHANVGSS